MIRLAAVLALIGTPAAADCRLALALGFDVSASVDMREYRLMMQGTADALRDTDVRRAVLAGAPVALAAYVWAGALEQAIAVDWTVIDSAVDLARFADALAGFPRPSGDPLGRWSGRTGVGAALLAGGQLLDRAPACDRQTIDLVGDGVSNDGPDSAILPGITVNALAIGGNLPLDHDGAFDGLSAWFEANILQGPEAFTQNADGFEDFAQAIRLKLLRELQPLLLGALR